MTVFTGPRTRDSALRPPAALSPRADGRATSARIATPTTDTEPIGTATSTTDAAPARSAARTTDAAPARSAARTTDAAPAAPTASDPLSGARWEALGTSVHLLTTHPAALQPATDAVRRVLQAVDETYSRFRPDSELQRLTARPASTVPVSHLLARAVEAALRAARLTDGAVDPTVGRAVRVVGYDRDFADIGRSAHIGRLPDTRRSAGADDRSGPIAIQVESVPGWQRIRLDVLRRMLEIPRGVELDLGSTGKALAADLAAEAAFEAARMAVAESDATADVRSVGVLVNLGGDIATAGMAPVGGWRIALTDDARLAPEDTAEHVILPRGAIATSSTTVRRWTRDGTERHHIIDPSTGLPAETPWRTVSVIAATCVDANAGATAAIVRGATAPSWLVAVGLPARLISNEGVVVRVGGWPDPAEGPVEPRDAARAEGPVEPRDAARAVDAPTMTLQVTAAR